MISLLFLLTAITFGCRYIFLEPKLPIHLNYKAKHFLSYSAPAVLAAIAAPILLLPEGKLALALDNRYIWAALVAVIIMLSTKRMLLSVILSFSTFLLLGQLM